ncbi:MAG: hypothetical protein V1915_02285 [Candidatus Bathyarchaeota archaeon]
MGGSVLLGLSLFLLGLTILDPYITVLDPYFLSFLKYYPMDVLPKLLGGLLLFLGGWVIYQYGRFKETGEQIAVGVKDGIKVEIPRNTGEINDHDTSPSGGKTPIPEQDSLASEIEHVLRVEENKKEPKMEERPIHEQDFKLRNDGLDRKILELLTRKGYSMRTQEISEVLRKNGSIEKDDGVNLALRKLLSEGKIFIYSEISAPDPEKEIRFSAKKLAS